MMLRSSFVTGLPSGGWKSFKSWALGLSVACGAMASASAAVIVQDPFTDGGFTNGADALDTAWYSAASAASPALTVGTQAGFGSGNSLSVVGNGTFQRVYATLPSTSLAVGETLNMSFDVNIVSASATNAGAFRFGLFTVGAQSITANNQQSLTSDYKGWVNIIGIGTNGTTLGAEAAGDVILGGNPGIGGISGATLTNTQLVVGSNYQIEYVITRTGATTGTAVLLLNGVQIGSGTRTGLDNTDFTWGLLGFGSGDLTLGYRLDNVTVGVVPEPGRFALLGLGLAAWGMRRRR